LTQEELKMIHYQRMKKQMKKERSRARKHSRKHPSVIPEEDDNDYFSMRGGVTKTERSGHSVRCSPGKEDDESYNLAIDAPLTDQEFPHYSSPSMKQLVPNSARGSPYE
jgi:hypothetical protein